MPACMPRQKPNTIFLLALSPQPQELRGQGIATDARPAACQHFVSIAVLTRCAGPRTRCSRCGFRVSVTGLLSSGSQRRYLWSALSYHVRRCGRPSAHRIVCEVRP
jgi:hypothetical protein